LIGPAFWSAERRARSAAQLGILFPLATTRRWVGFVSLLVVALALRGTWGDPGRPYWSVAAVLTASALLGSLAVWSRLSLYVHASGLLIVLAGTLIWEAWLVEELGIIAWFAWGPGVLDTFAYTQVVGFALAGALWSAIEWILRGRTPPVVVASRFLPFR